MAKHRENRIVEDVQRNLGFLLDNGYQIREVRSESFATWHVLLEAPHYFMRINCDRHEISVLFDPEKTNSRNQIGLETLVYYFSKGKHFVGYSKDNLSWRKKKPLEKVAILLNEYHEQIVSLFESDSQAIRQDIALSQKKYSELLHEDFSQKFAADEQIWKGLNLFAPLFRIIGLGFLAYLGWGVSIMFITATDISLKLLYGSIAAAIIATFAILVLRWLKDLQR